MTYDLLILGGGPAGFRAAERAGHFCMTSAIFEGKALGGTCLNEGCIPTKTMLYSAKLYDYAKGGGGKYGVTTTGAAINHGFVIARKDKIVKKLVMGVEMQMKKAGAEVVRANGVITGRSADGMFLVEAAGQTYAGKHLLIASGASAAVPPVPGLNEALKNGFALTNREILALKEAPKRLVVMGAGAIGLEMASYFNSIGTEVVVVEMLDRIGGRTDRDIAALLQRNYTAKGVKFILGAKIASVEGGFVRAVDSSGANLELEADKLLIAAGRKPNTAGIGLESLGIETIRGAVKTDNHMRTNVPGVFAAGDVNGISMLAHTAYREAETAVNVMRGTDDVMRYDAIPSVIYTNPEAAAVGETEETAAEKGLTVKTLKLPMLFSGRYQAENEGGNGILKMIFDDEKHILGAAMLGSPASEIIPVMAVAIEQHLTAAELAKSVFPHPTVAEILRDAALMTL